MNDNGKSKLRSAVTNGTSLFIGTLDGEPLDVRSIGARRFSDILASILSDMGGQDAISEAEYQMARRCATLALNCEFMESRLVAGHPFAFELSVGYVTSLAYLTIFGSIIAFGAYLTLLGRIGAHKAGYAMVMFPVVAVVLSMVFEGLQLDVNIVLGTLFVLAGNVYVLETKQERRHNSTHSRPGFARTET